MRKGESAQERGRQKQEEGESEVRGKRESRGVRERNTKKRAQKGRVSKSKRKGE